VGIPRELSEQLHKGNVVLFCGAGLSIFDLGVDFDSLRGEGKPAKARELAAYLQHRRELDHLIAAIRRECGGMV
jgi:hypothetical protein